MDNNLYREELEEKIQDEVHNFLDVLNKINEEYDESFICDFIMNYVIGILINYFSWIKSEMTENNHHKELKVLIEDILNDIKYRLIERVVLKESKMCYREGNILH